jgi:predicted nucleotidyltransferase component of viral defense system
MSMAIIQERLLTYQCQTIIEQENALKEIAQEIALLALSRSGFFRVAAFQDGTCLRILYGLERFSEDLNFVLETKDENFIWDKYINNMHEEFSAYGFTLEVQSRAKLDNAIRTAFLKADSAGGMLVLKDRRTNKPKCRIKLEIDTHPPQGATFELKYLDFPLPYSIRTQDLPSLFAGKCHALLCRNYIKGRDWYDFVWYISRLTPINFTLLNHAIAQAGPWKEQDISVKPQWFLAQLQAKINSMDWKEARQDVARFLRPKELATLELWSKDFFLSRLEKLAGYVEKKSIIS